MEVLVDEQLSSCYRNDITVVNTKSTVEVAVVKLLLDSVFINDAGCSKRIQTLVTVLSSIEGLANTLSSDGNQYHHKNLSNHNSNFSDFLR